MKLVLEDLTDAQIEAIRALIDKQKPVQKWEPKGGGWCIDLQDNNVYPQDFPEKTSCIAGLSYSTREQAQHALKSIRAYARQLAWLAENDDGCVADWSSADQPKYYVVFNHDKGEYIYSYCWQGEILSSVTMSPQNAEKLVKLLNDGVVEF